MIWKERKLTRLYLGLFLECEPSTERVKEPKKAEEVRLSSPKTKSLDSTFRLATLSMFEEFLRSYFKENGFPGSNSSSTETSLDG